MLAVQVVRGRFLCFAYRASSFYSFSFIDMIIRDIKSGDIVRKIHAKGASLFFLFLYLHTGRGIY
jgi:ubiquinol-cytochrome c reductase cytochrome b subunit